MRKVIVSINITLDGFIAGPYGELDWHFPLWNEEMSDFAYEQLCMMDSILLGRVTYQAMASYWPYEAHNTAGGSRGLAFANMMNNYTKFVFSKTLHSVEWRNSRLVKTNLAKAIADLKQQPGLDMIIYGSGSIVSRLMQLDLVDELVLWLHPVVLGKGIPLFRDLQHPFPLRLLRTKTFSSGVVVLYYGKAKPTAGPVKTARKKKVKVIR